MNMIFKLMIFSIVLNAAAGIMINAVVDSDGDKIFSETWMTGGVSYNANYTTTFESNMGEYINPNGELEDQGDAGYRILDMLGLGFLIKFKNVVFDYMFGFVKILRATLGGLLDAGTGDTTVSNVVFGTLQSIIFVGYVLGIYMLFTGKDIGGGSN